MTRVPQPTRSIQPRAFLFGVEWKNSQTVLSVEDSLLELEQLCRTAGLEVVEQDIQRLSRPDPATLIGKGKLEELQRWVEETQASVVVFDEELSPRHLRDIQQVVGDEVLVLDRTALILDIFSQHAHSREGALQVELAQYEYRLPRLTRAWTHLARQAGGSSGRGGTGGVGLRGPGETQLEIDKREIGRKITKLKRDLEAVRRHRQNYRMRRRKSGVPIAALVGYTNAGKSTLLNALTNSDVFVADQLFATLDPTTRQVRLPSGKRILVTDTVGFIQKLPSSLIAAFRATLEEISEADLLIHVVDSTHPQASAQAETVYHTLKALDITRIPMVTALNKSDSLPPDIHLAADLNLRRSVLISALQKRGLDNLLRAIDETLRDMMIPIRVQLPYQQGKLINLLHTEGYVEKIIHRENGMIITGWIQPAYWSDFEPYLRSERSTK